MNANYDDNIFKSHQEKIEKMNAHMNVYVQHKKAMNELINKEKNGKDREKKTETTRED